MGTQNRRVQAIVRGYVQGVGFRWRTREVARRLGVRGYVRNRPDRTVEVVAEGSERALNELLSFLREGPSAAHVESVDVSWLDGRAEFHGFEVRF
jgi:acylphosphatase